MNEILQKRIEEAVESIISSNLVDLGDLVNQYDLRRMLIEMGVKTLQNQWISVDDGLPPVENTYNDEESGIVHKWSKSVLIRTHKGGAYLDSYVFHRHTWTNNGEDVTHWMPIPQLEGGEK